MQIYILLFWFNMIVNPFLIILYTYSFMLHYILVYGWIMIYLIFLIRHYKEHWAEYF